MKILFSPSEAKSAAESDKKIDKNSFMFPDLYDFRVRILNLYNEFLKTATPSELSKLFGLKNLKECENLRGDIFKKGVVKAVLRYDGVAYKYLNYKSLDAAAQNFIDKNVIIFSNLLGPVLAGDIGLPDYKLKQNEKIGGFELEKFYYVHFSDALDNFLKDDEILDLRAGFYEKFYTIKKNYATIKFVKSGKVLSHWAKAYRGAVLNLLAKNNVKNVSELIAMEIDDLYVKEIIKQGLKMEIVYEIK